MVTMKNISFQNIFHDEKYFFSATDAHYKARIANHD